MVERTGLKKIKVLAFCSKFSGIPLISHYNLQNQTAIFSIGVQSQQLVGNQSKISSISILTNSIILVPLPCGRTHATSPTRGRMTNRICKLRNICNLSNPTAISAIRLQSSWIIVRLHRLIWIAKQNWNPISRNLPDTRWDDQPYM